jgi:hypothetical protein
MGDVPDEDWEEEEGLDQIWEEDEDALYLDEDDDWFEEDDM